MEYIEYNFNGKLDLDRSEEYINLAERIREYFPKNKTLKIEQEIISVYRKNKNKAKVEMNIKIFAENGEENKEVKNKLEEILGDSLIKK